MLKDDDSRRRVNIAVQTAERNMLIMLVLLFDECRDALQQIFAMLRHVDSELLEAVLVQQGQFQSVDVGPRKVDEIEFADIGGQEPLDHIGRFPAPHIHVELLLGLIHRGIDHVHPLIL